MAETSKDTSVFWVDPERRGVIPLNGFHVSKSLRKRLLSGKYKFTINTCFELVLDACANRDETWINPAIRTRYNELHHLGFAHSVEVWKDDELAGGLYGVSIGGAFFGESMFSTTTDGSKLALVALVARLKVGGFTLLDTQFLTDHLATMGGIEVARKDFRNSLEVALEIDSDLWKLPAETSPYELWQLSTQTS
ncbi:leucyl/phenylalanyl-tRNA--protein transferase [Rhodobacterales bacterium 52_120_T64]|nr:leucyl/phenylalanyl-tRNA--protein transferase [Rhodobacterales bacterium 52_120_T64]